MSRNLQRAIQITVSLACFALLWRLADGEAALRQLASAHPVWICAALAMLSLQTLLSALRWRLTACQLGIRLTRGAAVREYYLSQLVNQLLPGGVLGDAGRAIRARDEAGLVASGQAVMFERLAGQLALCAVLAVGVLSTQLVPGGFDGPAWLLPATLLLPVGAGLALWWTGRGHEDRQGQVVRALHGIRRAFGHAVAAPAVRTAQLAMSLGTALCNIAAFVCCANAAGVTLSVPSALVLVPLILFSMLIPLTVSGWGLREGAAATLLPLAGASSAGALAASVAFGLTLLVAALPGLIVLALAAAPDPRSGPAQP